jgi:small subunit ribosomal protein S2
VDFAIPANDDATKSISKILDVVIESIADGLAERKNDKDKTEEGENQAPKGGGENRGRRKNTAAPQA